MSGLQKKRLVPSAYTQDYGKRQQYLFVNVGITPPNTYQMNIQKVDDNYMFNGIWDTGASSTAISEDVVKKLNLPIVSMMKVNTANGESVASVHIVDLYLPNRVVIPNLLVTSAKLSDPIQILVGMDVITLGDFTISNFNMKTTLSFRTPSFARTDYVKLANDINPKINLDKTGRNEPCPCGSGKKYKNCCGKKI